MAQVFEILKLIPKRSRTLFTLFTIARSALGLLDLFGILLMGLLIAKTSQSIGLKIQFSLIEFLNELNLFQIATLVLIAFVLKSIFSVIFTRSLSRELAKAEAVVSTNLYERILRSDFNKISKFSKQKLIFGLSTSATSSIINLLTVVSTIISESFMLAVILIAFTFVNLQLTIFIFIYFAFIGLILNKYIGQLSFQAGKQNAFHAVKANQAVEDSLSAFRELKAYRKEHTFVDSFYEARKNSAQAIASLNYIASLPRFIVEPALLIGAVLLAGFSLSSPGGLATLGIFLTGGLRIMAAMLPLQMAFSTLSNLTAMAENFLHLNKEFQFENFSENRQLTSESNLEIKEIGPVGVEVTDLNFKYENELPLVLSDIHLRIPAGSLVALIGPSGSGKSTLADIIVGGVSQSSGTIKFTNQDGFELTRNEINFGYVPQEPGIVSGTVLENITLSQNLENVDENLLSKALTLSHLDGVILKLSNGLNSKVGEQMEDLSGGQFQRIGLARALYANPNILVLDEATSALDMETENAIKDALVSLKDKVTTLVIAHRLSTVKNADMVFVLEAGKVVDSGIFQELMARNKLVARYVELSELNSD